MHPRNNSTNRFSLFEKFAGNYKNKKILDYGGSRGNLLYFSQGKIQQENYTCIDVEKDAIEQGKIEFPNANFMHYDRYNWMYNHNGNMQHDFPKLYHSIDIIWAYSVFSHTDLDEFIAGVKWFTKLDFELAAISFLTFNEMLEWAYNKRFQEYNKCVDIKKYKHSLDHNMLYFFDNNKLIFDKIKLKRLDYKYLLSFYNTDFLLNTFSDISSLYNIDISYLGDGYIPFLCLEKKNVV